VYEVIRLVEELFGREILTGGLNSSSRSSSLSSLNAPFVRFNVVIEFVDAFVVV